MKILIVLSKELVSKHLVITFEVYQALVGSRVLQVTDMGDLLR